MLSQISKHVASLTEGEIVEESDLGSIRRLTADVFPILKGLSIKRLLINPGTHHEFLERHRMVADIVHDGQVIRSESTTDENSKDSQGATPSSDGFSNTLASHFSKSLG